QLDLVEQAKAAGTVTPLEWEPQLDYGDDVFARVEAVGTDAIAAASQITVKADRNAATDTATTEIIAQLAGEFPEREREIKAAAKALQKKVIRKRVVTDGLRIDGRGPRDLRPLSAEVAVVPTAHGSGLFQRGETQVLTVATLAMPKMD